MNVPRKKLTVAGALLLAFLVLCYTAFHWVIRSEGFRTRLQSELNKRTGYEVRIDDLRLSPWLSLTASGVIVSKNGAVLFQGKRIVCFLSSLDLFYGRISRLSLESPRLHLSLQDIFSSSNKSSPNLTIGTLNIDDGEIVLETGHGEPVALRSIFVNARNVSLSGDIGLQLRTYVPAVNGTVALSVSGGAAEKQAKIAVEQAEEKSPVRLLPKMGAEKTVLEARFDIKKKENGVYEVKGSGRADEFRLGPERIQGQIDSQFVLDAKLKSLLFSLDLKMSRFPAKLLPVEIPLNPGPVSATLEGDYAAAQNILTLRKISAVSGIGVLAGGGAVALGEKPARLTAGLRLREIALDSLKPLMPEPLRAFTYTGKLAADLNLSGAYDDPMVTGLAWNDGAKVAGENISLAQLSSKIPFQWARSSLRVKAGQFQVKDLVVGRKGKTQFKVQEASLAGDVVKEPLKPLGMTAEFQILEGRFATTDESKMGEHLNVQGQIDSQFVLDAKLKSLLFSLDLKMSRFPAKLLPVEIPLNPGPVSATLEGDYAAAQNILTLRKISAVSGIGVLAGGGAVALGEKPARLTAGLRLREIALDSLKPLMPEPLRAFTYTGKLAADLNLSGAYDDPMVTGLAWNDGAKVAGENISLAQLSSKIPFQWARSSLRVKAGQFQVKDLVVGRKGKTQFKVQEASLAGDVVKEPLKPLGMTAEFQILEGRFATTDESKMGEHLNFKGRLTCQDCTGDAVFKGEARVESLELLWNKFFGDFKDRKSVIEVDGNYRREEDDLRLDQLRVSLASIGHLDLRGSVQHLLAKPEFSLEIHTDNLLPAGFYNFFIRDTFKANHPILGQIGVAGKSSLAIRTQGSLEAFTVEGKLSLQQGEIQERSGSWRVGPVALDLPLKVRFPQAANENPGEATPVGKLSVREVKAGSTTIPEISAPVILWNNSLRFPEPIRISLFGGRCMIEKLAWKDVINAPADLSFSLGLDDLRLLELTEALGWHRFGGSLSGSIPEVRWTGDSLKSEGAITLNMFGGRVAIRGMEIGQPLSPVRSIKMNARVEGLDLEQASETFEFGRISGVLAGTIEDLVFTQGQPAEFRAGIQTVDTPGVSQWISVEALNKITVLSSGNEAGSIYGGIAGFFDFFRYSKLGFKTALKNDKMILRGVETRNGQEYLVVGTLLPPTVNIVSHTQEIGFRELLRRLERVQKSGSSKSSARP